MQKINWTLVYAVLMICPIKKVLYEKSDIMFFADVKDMDYIVDFFEREIPPLFPVSIDIEKKASCSVKNQFLVIYNLWSTRHDHSLIKHNFRVIIFFE